VHFEHRLSAVFRERAKEKRPMGAGATGQLPVLPLLHGGSAGAEKCPFAM